MFKTKKVDHLFLQPFPNPPGIESDSEYGSKFIALARKGAKMSVFKELVEHHIQEEESKIFKSAEKALDHDEIQNIMKMFGQEKQRIKKTLK